MDISPAIKQEFAEFLDSAKSDFSPEQLEDIDWAMRMAYYAHRGDYRESGDDYYLHLLGVLKILYYEWKIRNYLILCAALLHDIVEDSEMLKPSDIKKRLGEDAAAWVMAVTKPRPGDQRFAGEINPNQARREFHYRSVKEGDWPVQIIKLGDNLHNIRTLNYCQEEKQQRKVVETKKYYLPLIEGIGDLRPDLPEVIRRAFIEALKQL